MKVYFEQRTIHGNKNCIALYLHNDDIAADEIFAFSDELACATATEICEELAEDSYTDNDICDGTIGNTPCLFLFEEGYTSNTAKFFYFENERDLRTAYEMANRYMELKDDDGEDDEDENARQDAYDDARHVYEAAIEKGCSEQDARAKASRVLDEQLSR